MKTRIGTLGCCLIGIFFSSCTREFIQSGGDGEAVPVRLSIVTAPMQTAGVPMTRTTTDKTNDELAVHTTWLLQFNGNTAAGRLLKAEEVTFTNNALETELLHTDAVCRLYVVANSDCSSFAADAAAGNGIPLADFEASLSAFAAAKTIDPAQGLPMCGYQDFNPRTDAPVAAFTLKPLVAKLTFKLNIEPGFASGFTVNSITLKQVATVASYGEVAPGAAAVRPAGVAYTGELDLAGADVSAVTCYLPENLSGRKPELKYMSERGKTKAPEKATYVEVAGTMSGRGGYIYSFFLGDGTAADFNVVRNVHYNLAATLNGTNLADGRMEIVFADLNADGRTANCYLVYGNNIGYAFDATVMGNGATTEAATQGGTAGGARIVPQPLAPRSAKVLWETGTVQGAVVSEVKLSSDKKKVVFKTGSTAGNAVIAVYDNVNPDDANAKILWSWHVWKPETEVTDLPYQKYVDDTGVVKTAGNYRMMDRNLGATVTTPLASWGLFYQWGRKDPFPGTGGKVYYGDAYQSTVPSLSTDNLLNNLVNSSTLSLADNAAYIAYTIGHPTTFLKSSGDWVKVNQDNLWGNPREGLKQIYTVSSSRLTVNSGYGSKSIYDPCPVGYRVPPSDTWTALKKADGTQYGNGKDDANSKFNGAPFYAWTSTSMSPAGATISFPASGFINNENGYLGSAANQGWYWSSSPCCSDASYEHAAAKLHFFQSGSVKPETYDSRATGNLVRCVRELD